MMKVLQLSHIFKNIINENLEYAGEHSAPSKDDAPLYDLTKYYPDDIYGNDAVKYYGDHENDAMDRTSISIIKAARNKPNYPVKIYRAVPDLNYDIKKKLNVLYDLRSYHSKFGFYPLKNKIIYDLQDKYPVGKYSYDEQQMHIKDYINKQIYTLIGQMNDKLTINNGDWVTINREYAKQHGVSHLNNKYVILTKTVKASNLFTDANSIHEWGYNV